MEHCLEVDGVSPASTPARWTTNAGIKAKTWQPCHKRLAQNIQDALDVAPRSSQLSPFTHPFAWRARATQT
jgi:hypothetical protein